MKQTDEAVFKKKLLELASRANGSGRCTFTPFLGLAEQNILRCAEKELSGVIRTEFGGADGCERIMVRFGGPEDCGYACPFPIRCIRAIPRSKNLPSSSRTAIFSVRLWLWESTGTERATLPFAKTRFIFSARSKSHPILLKISFPHGERISAAIFCPAGHYGRERFARAAAAAGIAFHPSHRAMQCCKRKA